jgi:hypothetical protein
MSRRNKAKAKAAAFNPAEVVEIVKSNPYIHRLIEDAHLRDSIATAMDSSRSAYGRLANGRTPAKLMEDKKLQRDLQVAFSAARDATTALVEAPKKKARKGLTFGRVVIVATVGTGVAMVASEGLRSKVLDTLFGAEEEFEYTPPANTTPAPPSSPVSAA